MSGLSIYNYHKDKDCKDENIHTNINCNNFTNLAYGASLKSMRYTKAKRNKPVHL